MQRFLNQSIFFALVASLSLTEVACGDGEKEPISGYDWGFVGVSLVCELYVLRSLLSWFGRDNYGWLKGLDYLSIICFSADIAFSVGKLFPGPKYNCDSWSCRKVTHTCTMTLCSCVFGLVEARLLHKMTEYNKTKSQSYSRFWSTQRVWDLSCTMHYHRILLERAQQCSLSSHPWPRSS